MKSSKESKPVRRAEEGSVLGKVAKGGKIEKTGAGEQRVKAAARGTAAGGSGGDKPALSLCGIDPKMDKAEVLARLKLLYRRYNRGASSLDARMRSESERMLDAIVEVREKYLGPI